MIAGCGADLLINILLTFLGFVLSVLRHAIVTNLVQLLPWPYPCLLS